MRIFFSHSWRDKPLLREIQRNLPAHVRAWIDDKELLLGEELESSIRSAIRFETDFVIIFIGPESVRSKWVRRELAWALDRESEVGRIFVLPVLLEERSWVDMPELFQGRKYLLCSDFSETGVRDFSKRLADDLFGLVSRYSNLTPNVHSLERGDAAEREARVRRLAKKIADNQSNPREEARLTKERLELIVSSLEALRKVELLVLYELIHGKFKGKTTMGEIEDAQVLQVEFRMTKIGVVTHNIQWSARPFPDLQERYGLGNKRQQVRDVFLEKIKGLTEVERREMFSGIEILRCSFRDSVL